MSSQEERKLKIAQAFEKWQLTISTLEEEEHFLWFQSEYDDLLGPLVMEMELEDTQNGSPKTPPLPVPVVVHRNPIQAPATPVQIPVQIPPATPVQIQ